MPDQKKAYIYGLATVLLWSTVASAFKLSLRFLEPAQLLFYSSIVSTLVLAFIVAIQGKIRLIFSYSPQQYLRSAALGFLNPFLYYIFLFKAYDLLPAQEALCLNYTWAIALVLLSIPILKQKIGIQDITATFICYSGVVIIATHGDILDLRFSSPLCVILALASTVIWALYWIFYTKDDRDPCPGLLPARFQSKGG
jgi:drug/metabolite transporter (DMT)-like permease